MLLARHRKMLLGDNLPQTQNNPTLTNPYIIMEMVTPMATQAVGEGEGVVVLLHLRRISNQRESDYQSPESYRR